MFHRRPPDFSDALPFSIGARTINKDWFGMDLKDVWSILSDYLFLVGYAYNLRIHVFVLMNNHFHLIASAPENNLGSAMQYFLAQTSRQITKSCGRINHTWRAKFFRCLITSDRYYLHAYKYIYRNPVEAGICEHVEAYPYSTLHGLIGNSRLTIPISCDETLFSNFEGTLSWLNTPTSSENREAIRRALRRKKFKLPRHPTSGLRHPLEDGEY